MEEVTAIMGAAGLSAALLPMEENEADMADEADEGQEAELNNMLNHLKI